MPTGHEEARPITQLIYASRAARSFDDDQLLRLLQQAQESNEGRGVTGMLLYHDGTFVQAIEGDASAIDELFERISGDPRHTDVTVVARSELAERSFGDWSMGYRRIDRSTELPPGLDDFLESGFVSLDGRLDEEIRETLLGFVGLAD